MRKGFGIDKILKKLKKTEDLRPLHKRIGLLVSSTTKLRFNKGTDPKGNPWKPRSSKYVERLSKQGRLGPRVLILSGRLQRSISFNSNAREVNVGSDLVYASVHNRGYSPRNIPKRQYLGLSERDRREIRRLIGS